MGGLIRAFPVEAGGPIVIPLLAGAPLPWTAPGNRVELAESAPHADLLVVRGPVPARLLPSIGEVYGQMPLPRAVAMDDLETDDASGLESLPRARREPDTPGARRPPEAREIATEDAVVSVGPLAPLLAAGPFRLVLTCDGEQVVAARIEAGYASRGLEAAATRGDFEAGLRLAAAWDPTAPWSGALAYVRALEALSGIEIEPHVAARRGLLLALERAAVRLGWAARLALLVGRGSVARRAACAAERAAAALRVTAGGRPPYAVLVPGGLATDLALLETTSVERTLDGLPEESTGIASALADGWLAQARLRPTGQVEVHDRLGAARDALRAAAGLLEQLSRRTRAAADIRRDWNVPAGRGRGEVEGPRGPLVVEVESHGGSGPSWVCLRGPSTARLEALPDRLADLRLADALVAVALLDLCTWEAEA